MKKEQNKKYDYIANSYSMTPERPWSVKYTTDYDKQNTTQHDVRSRPISHPVRAHLTRITLYHTTNQGLWVINSFSSVSYFYGSQVTAGVNHLCASSGCEALHWHCIPEAIRILVFVCGIGIALAGQSFVKQLIF